MWEVQLPNLHHQVNNSSSEKTRPRQQKKPVVHMQYLIEHVLSVMLGVENLTMKNNLLYDHLLSAKHLWDTEVRLSLFQRAGEIITIIGPMLPLIPREAFYGGLKGKGKQGGHSRLRSSAHKAQRT